MFDSLLNWLNGKIAEAVGNIIQNFMEFLSTLNADSIINYFPVLPKAFVVFQSLAVAMVILIAGRSLFNFFGASAIEENRFSERPVTVVLRAIVAIALVYFGNYLLDMILKLALIPFNVFINMDVAYSGPVHIGGAGGDVVTAMAVGLGGIGALAGLSILARLFFLLIISWNLIKLMLEVAERVLVVMFLVYTSPLYFSASAGRETAQIAKKGVQMFISGCLLLSLSAFSFKVIVSGFAHLAMGEVEYTFGRYILILAACKVAQRIDTYMQQMGMTTAITGGNILDDLVAVGGFLGGVKDKAMGVAAGTRAAANKARARGADAEGVRQAARSGFMGGVLGMKPGAFMAKQESEYLAEEKRLKDLHDRNQRASQQRSRGGSHTSAIAPSGAPQVTIGTDKIAEKKAETDGQKYVPGGEARNHLAAAGGSGTGFSVGARKDIALNDSAYEQGVSVDARGNLQETTPGALSAFMQKNFSEDAKIEGMYRKGMKHSDRTETRTAANEMKLGVVEKANAPFAESVLYGTTDALANNDELGTACINKFMGADSPAREFTNFRAENLDGYTDQYGQSYDGGRVVTANYDKEGEQRVFTLMDEAAYTTACAKDASFTATEFTSNSGNRYYYTDIPAVSDPAPEA